MAVNIVGGRVGEEVWIHDSRSERYTWKMLSLRLWVLLRATMSRHRERSSVMRVRVFCGLLGPEEEVGGNGGGGGLRCLFRWSLPSAMLLGSGGRR